MKALLTTLAVVGAAAYQNHEIVAKVNSNSNGTWTAGHNPRFAGMSLAEIKGLCGTKVSAHSELRPKNPSDTFRNSAIPESFDSRDAWPACESIKSIRDQGNCGSCWAFGAAESFSDRYCIASGQTQQRVFSPHALTACSELNFGCNGGQLATAWYFIERNGLPLDECQPYHIENGKTPPCNWGTCTNTSNSWATWKVSSTSNPGCGFFSCSADDMAADIMKNGPIEGSFSVYEDFISYTGGIYQYTTGSFLGGHAIKIIGWGTENGIPYWLIANSWGTTWGENGFFRIRRGRNEVGIESNNGAGIPIVV